MNPKIETPGYVLVALSKAQKGEPIWLEQLFRHGIPLHLYQESRDFLSAKILNKPTKGKGRPRKNTDFSLEVAAMVAQYLGAGLSQITKPAYAGQKIDHTAAAITAAHFGISQDTANNHYKKHEKDSPEFIEENKIIGESIGDFLRENNK